MRIGIDYHGVIDSNPEFFRQLANFLHIRKYKVYVITGNFLNSVFERDLEPLIKCDKILSIPSYHLKKKTAHYFDLKGNFHIDSKLWDSTKAKFCKKYKIDVHIDDSDDYGKYFKTPYLRYDFKKNTFTDISSGLKYQIKDPYVCCKFLIKMYGGRK